MTFTIPRHSQAIISGENLPLVGKLLGHRQHRITASYAHLADDKRFATADARSQNREALNALLNKITPAHPLD